MYHIGFLLVLVWVILTPDVDISNIPLGQLTLAMIAEKVFSYAKIFGGVWLLYRSVEHDKIWPWRWDRFFVADLVSALFVWSVAIWIGSGAKKNEEITMLTCIVLGGLAYAYILHKGFLQNEAKEQALKRVTFDRSRFPDGFDDHAAKTCIDIYVDQKFEKTRRAPVGTCYVDTGDGWAIEANFPKLGLIQVVREWLI